MSRLAPWRDWSLRTRSLVTVLIPLLVLILATIVVVQAARATASAEDDVRSGIQVLSDIHALHASLAEAASGVRGYLLTRDERFLAPYWRAVEALPARLDRLDQRARDPVLRTALEQIEVLSAQKMGDLQQMISGLDQPGAPGIEILGSNKRLLDQIRDTILEMEQREQVVIDARERSADRARTRNLWLSVFAVILGIGAAVVTATLFSKDLISRIHSLGRNAKLLAEGATPAALPAWNDELGELGDRLHTASRLLSARAEDARRARDDAQAANRAKTDFLSRISHELRTPLNAILGFSRVLRSESDSERQRQHCQHVIDAGEHLLDLVNDVMDISRIEADALAFNLQPVLIDEMLATVAKLTGVQAAQRRITIQRPDVPGAVCVRADPQRLRQILINLLDNAIKFSPDDAIVGLTCAVYGDCVRLAVRDAGGGIDPRDHALLFAPFTRLDNASEIEGTGLGLALCKRLTEAMGGRIGVTSALGQGATFWVELPRDRPVIVAAGSATPLADTDPPPPARDVAKRVLYVEDNASNRILVETLLSRRPGCTLRTASTAAEGLKVMRQWSPGHVLLDWHLPDRSGLDVLTCLRRERPREGLTVIVISADALPETREAAMAAGADAFLLKPIDAAALYRALELSDVRDTARH
ncbi:hybrid sensor histidine kinase/response regulator [Polycyclovorans algicola]|uniref:hybrid sensor histidine kinase/response regulator n=1 Tax=Polycyclovorans algicola TaxID=616992 RepID=UPI0004A6F4EB|nr:ATP-binding protein [Polycyclovorans algicola]